MFSRFGIVLYVRYTQYSISVERYWDYNRYKGEFHTSPYLFMTSAVCTIERLTQCCLKRRTKIVFRALLKSTALVRMDKVKSIIIQYLSIWGFNSGELTRQILLHMYVWEPSATPPDFSFCTKCNVNHLIDAPHRNIKKRTRYQIHNEGICGETTVICFFCHNHRSRWVRLVLTVVSWLSR